MPLPVITGGGRVLQRMLRAWNLVVYHERGRHGLAASRSAASAPPASPHHPSPPAALLCHGASGQGTSTGETVVSVVTDAGACRGGDPQVCASRCSVGDTSRAGRDHDRDRLVSAAHGLFLLDTSPPGPRQFMSPPSWRRSPGRVARVQTPITGRGQAPGVTPRQDDCSLGQRACEIGWGSEMRGGAQAASGRLLARQWPLTPTEILDSAAGGIVSLSSSDSIASSSVEEVGEVGEVRGAREDGQKKDTTEREGRESGIAIPTSPMGIESCLLPVNLEN